MTQKVRPRTLFITDSEDSKKAEELLKTHRVNFSSMHVEHASTVGYIKESDLPLLITGEGQWEGLTAIARYVKDQDRTYLG